MINLTDTERAAILDDATRNAVGAGVGDTIRLLADYDALERDYDALAAECERLRAEAANIRDRWTEYGREVEAQRDAALAELAALKGGQEAVAWHWIERGGEFNGFQSVERVSLKRPSNTQASLGMRPLFADPPAQASALVAKGWKLAADSLPATGKPVLAYYLNSHGMGRRIRAMHVKRFTVEAEEFADHDTQCCEYSEQDDCYYTTEGWYELIDNWPDYASCAVIEGVITHWMALPDAPTPGASDGKGGE